MCDTTAVVRNLRVSFALSGPVLRFARSFDSALSSNLLVSRCPRWTDSTKFRGLTRHWTTHTTRSSTPLPTYNQPPPRLPSCPALSSRSLARSASSQSHPFALKSPRYLHPSTISEEYRHAKDASRDSHHGIGLYPRPTLVVAPLLSSSGDLV